MDDRGIRLLVPPDRECLRVRGDEEENSGQPEPRAGNARQPTGLSGAQDQDQRG